ncbi:oligomeric Golgi complex subunit 7 [Plakobranchus ocellatus]|uniref:Conserved oligomeric Golgi complex subunit 7 n=1 Tax=Plakobranchus ocellatus TaxID=259542 RepID=A0AAV4CFP1_9GAST|nr:oligomeric Golgi complex subunit 7 [Plakobranchus ocellatus]
MDEVFQSQNVDDHNLLQSWNSIWEADKSKSALSQLYDLLLSTWHTQVKWSAQVFDDPVNIVLELLTQTLTTLDPSLATVFAALVSGGEHTLDILIELKQVVTRRQLR